MHALLINPNTTQAVTDGLVAQLQPWCAKARMPLMAITAPFGEPYIASEAAYATAGHAVLEAFATHVDEHGLPSAVLVGCFGDPSVWALRAQWPELPVTGLAEAAMREAQAHGPFTVVTGGQAWGPMLERLARCLRLAGPEGLVHVCTLEATGGDMAQSPDAAKSALKEACQRTERDWPQARAMVLGGAALGGWAADIAPSLDIPLIDNVEAGGRWLAQVLG